MCNIPIDITVYRGIVINDNKQNFKNMNLISKYETYLKNIINIPVNDYVNNLFEDNNYEEIINTIKSFELDEEIDIIKKQSKKCKDTYMLNKNTSSNRL